MIRPRTALFLYQYAAGLCDTSTGLLLLFVPVFALRLMGITRQPRPLLYASFVGVFVLCVGASYLMVLGMGSSKVAQASFWRGQWLITLMIRTAVALFVFSKVAFGAMEPAWLAVAFTDATFALVQWVGLRRDWIAFAE